MILRLLCAVACSALPACSQVLVQDKRPAAQPGNAVDLPKVQPQERPQKKSHEVRVQAIRQHGITWTLATETTAGQFVNGDWWVVGPVGIVSIRPRSGIDGQRTRHGSMRNPSPRLGVRHGYDSTLYGRYDKNHYDPQLNVALGVSTATPLVLPPGTSLVSTISRKDPGVRPQLQTAAVLTVLAKPAAKDAFRPPYCGSNKTPRHHLRDLQTWRLLRLKRPITTPSPAILAQRFRRCWLDHIPSWMGQEYAHPTQNMPNYGREWASLVGEASLCLLMDFSENTKRQLLIGFVQLGIDMFGIVEDGGQQNWVANGGHSSGRKWPILFAGLLLNDAKMAGIGHRRDVAFGEDEQTFYVRETSPGVLNHGHGKYTSEYRDLPEWGIRHRDHPERDNPSWDAKYRTCCTATAWSGYLLAARLMGAQRRWNHPALFDYMDRYLRESKRLRRPKHEISTSRFSLESWRIYRARAFPPQDLTKHSQAKVRSLRWQPAARPGQLLYQVWRGEQADKLQRFGKPQATRQITVQGKAGQALYFAVSTLDSKGVESVRSAALRFEF